MGTLENAIKTMRDALGELKARRAVVQNQIEKLEPVVKAISSRVTARVPVPKAKTAATKASAKAPAKKVSAKAKGKVFVRSPKARENMRQAQIKRWAKIRRNAKAWEAKTRAPEKTE